MAGEQAVTLGLWNQQQTTSGTEHARLLLVIQNNQNISNDIITPRGVLAVTHAEDSPLETTHPSVISNKERAFP